MKICTLSSVRGGDDDFPPYVWLDENSGRYVIRAINEGGFACVDLDLFDIAQWFGISDAQVIAALANSKHS